MADRAIKAAQLADQLRDHLAVWIRQDFPSELLTVRAVTLKPNLRDATVWVSCYTEDQVERIRPSLIKHTRSYQHRLRQSMVRQHLPNIHLEVTGPSDFSESLDSLLLK